jgi:hypothetical protein
VHRLRALRGGLRAAEGRPDYRLPYKSWFSYLLRGAGITARRLERLARARFDEVAREASFGGEWGSRNAGTASLCIGGGEAVALAIQLMP